MSEISNSCKLVLGILPLLCMLNDLPFRNKLVSLCTPRHLGIRGKDKGQIQDLEAAVTTGGCIQVITWISNSFLLFSQGDVTALQVAEQLLISN